MSSKEEDKEIDRQAREAKEQMIVEERLMKAVAGAGKIFYAARAEDSAGNYIPVFSVDGADCNVAKAMLARIIYDEMKRAGEKP